MTGSRAVHPSSPSDQSPHETSTGVPPPLYPKPRRTVLTRLQGFLFIAFLFIAGLYVCWLLFPLFFLLLLADVSLAQRCLDWFVAAFLSLPASLLEVFGVRFRAFGDPIPPSCQSEFAVLLSNHPTTADWMFLWNFLIRYGDLSQLKIVMKGQLRAAPVIGWALQLACHLFLARDWAQDQRHVQRLIHHYHSMRRPPAPWVASLFRHVLGFPSLQLLIFPEGTNLRPEVSAKANAFAAQRGEAAYTHVLHPRTTGFVYILRELTAGEVGQGKGLQAVWDLTVAFPETRIGLIEELFSGAFPHTIAIHCRRFPISALPTDEQGLTQWVQTRFREKEALLSRVYGGEGVKAMGKEMEDRGWRVWLSLRAVLLGWMAFASAMSVLMVEVWWLKWYALGCSLAFALLTYAGGGDALVLAVEEWRQRGTEGARVPARKKAQ